MRRVRRFIRGRMSASSTLEEMPPDQGDVLEDAQSEREERDQVEVEPEPVADECEQDCHDRVRDEAADEDAVVVAAIELRADRPQHRVERGEDGDRRVAREFEADVDVEDEPEQDADEQTRQGYEHLPPSLLVL